MCTFTPARRNVVAAVVATTAALLLRAWLQVTLQDMGYTRVIAADLSYLVVPPVLFVLLLPVFREDRHSLGSLFRRNVVVTQQIVAAIAIGLLIRVASWAWLITGISFGFIRNDNPEAIIGPVFHYQCPDPGQIVLGLVVASLFIPVIEEIVHRGYVQSLFHKRGPLIAITISAVSFMVFHRYSGWAFSLVGGIILGTMYWVSGSLWPPTIAHSVVNLTPIFTWRCMSLHWNPRPDSIPLWVLGNVAAAVLVSSAAAIAWLVLVKSRRQKP